MTERITITPAHGRRAEVASIVSLVQQPRAGGVGAVPDRVWAMARSRGSAA